MGLSAIIEKWDSILYSCYNILSDIKYFFKRPKYHKYLKRNKVLKNSHLNQRCFIVMNGPSINQYDLSALRNEYVFCANYFYRSELAKVICPNYYCWSDSKDLVDPEIAMPIFKEINCDIAGVQFIVNSKAIGNVPDAENIFYTYNKFMPHLFGNRSNLAGNTSNFSTVAFYAINAAIYMGFKEIYMVGLDFEPGAFKHFSDLGVECDDPKKQVDKESVCGNYWQYTKAQYESYVLAKFAKKRNCKIINVNLESCIRAFEFGQADCLVRKDEI